MRHVVLMMGLIVAGCGDDSHASDAGSGRDGGPIANSATPSPDGEGYCCPTGGPTCDCALTGGFEMDPAECWRHNICDAAPPDWHAEIDDHGCRYYRTWPPTVCCNCPPDAGPPDAGLADAGGEELDGGVMSDAEVERDAGDGGGAAGDAG